VKPIAFLALLATLAVAQRWDVEQVDSAGWGAAVDMRWHPDGRLFLCYSDTSGIIRLASRDSIWSYEDLPQWRPIRPGTQAFDIDRRGDIGVSYIGTDNLYWLALKTDTGWTDLQTPFNAGPYYPSLSSLDTAGAPAICVQRGDAYSLAWLRDTTWVTYTLANGYSGWTNDFDCNALGSVGGAIWGVFVYTGTYPTDGAYYCSLNRFEVRDSDVSVTQIASGAGGIGAASGCVDTRDSVHSCFYNYGQLYLDQTAIDAISVDQTSVRFDSLDRPQIAYTRRDSVLMYRCRAPAVWHVFDLRTGGVTALSLAIDAELQPMIAYTTGQGVYLARGVDIVGQCEESDPAAFDSPLRSTVARGVLFLSNQPSKARTVLLDMTGRHVGDLHSGANSVSGLAPGVYFVRQEPHAVTKVVITR